MQGSSRAFNDVFKLANEALRTVFGLEMKALVAERDENGQPTKTKKGGYSSSWFRQGLIGFRRCGC